MLRPPGLLFGALLFALTSCATPTPTQTPTPIPIVTEVVIATPLPTATLTATPTIEPSPTATLTPTPSPFPTPRSRIESNVPYCETAGVTVTMDLYLPTNNQPAPAVVDIHGGSWSAGDKAESETQPEMEALVQRGYIVASVNYRLAPKYKFPAQLEDVKCAVRFLRANATKYHLDTNRIGALGCSAGGQLAAMLGVTDASAGFEGKGGHANFSSRVQAVATMSTTFDFSLVNFKDSLRAETMLRVFDAKAANAPALTRASPINHVTRGDALFLILQGDVDGLTPFAQSSRFYQRLQSANVQATFIVVQNGDHCLPDDPAMFPSRASIAQTVADFFDKTLR
jgi:acetyl esterase/lipase